MHTCTLTWTCRNVCVLAKLLLLSAYTSAFFCDTSIFGLQCTSISYLEFPQSKLCAKEGNHQWEDTQGESWDFQTDWSQSYRPHDFEKDKQRKQFEQSGGVLYKRSCLSQKEFNLIQTDLEQLSLKLVHETSNSVGRKRTGAKLPSDCDIVKMLKDKNGGLSKLVNSLVVGKKRMILSNHVPVEMRVYEKSGAGMEWHVDDVLFKPAQMEIVFTTENTSDCVTSYEETISDKSSQQDYPNVTKPKRVELETEPNSAIIIKAGGVNHCVSSLKHGKRVILKIVYVQEDARLVDSEFVDQFHSKRSSQKGVKRSGRKRTTTMK